MEYIGNRGRRIVFVGNCILNQNVRAPGVAVQSGAFRDFVQILLRNGIGIEQFPCPEYLIDLMRLVKSSGMTLDNFENPRLEKLGPFMHSALIDGAGAFAGSIKKELSRRHLDIKMTGWNPWDNSETEAARIGRSPDLEIDATRKIFSVS